MTLLNLSVNYIQIISLQSQSTSTDKICIEPKVILKNQKNGIIRNVIHHVEQLTCNIWHFRLI